MSEEGRNSTSIRVGTLDELSPDRVLHARLPPEPHGTPREALVLLDDDGVLRAYLNRCKHLPIPLDGGSRRFLDDDRRHLMCGTHGALFRRHDGYCFIGPCRGDSLTPLTLRLDADGVIWIDPG